MTRAPSRLWWSPEANRGWSWIPHRGLGSTLASPSLPRCLRGSPTCVLSSYSLHLPPDFSLLTPPSPPHCGLQCGVSSPPVASSSLKEFPPCIFSFLLLQALEPLSSPRPDTHLPWGDISVSPCFLWVGLFPLVLNLSAGTPNK